MASLRSDILLSMGWTYLLVAGIFEIVWAAGLKFTESFTRWWPSLGVGAAGTAIIDIILFNESTDLVRIVCILLIVLGVVGLKPLYTEN